MRQRFFIMMLAVCTLFGLTRCGAVSPSAQKMDIKDFVDVEYECSYSLKFLDDTIKMIQGIEDVIKVKIGEDLSYQYSYNSYHWDSSYIAVTSTRNKEVIERFMQNDRDRRNVNLRSDGRSRNNDFGKFRLYKDYKNKKITVTDYISIHGFIYEEELIPQKWTIQDDTMTIADYVCQKATCDYRGRSYEAWFTPDIPIVEGPWKFYGLPGLIMKLNDTEHHYEFELVEFRKIEEKIDAGELSQNKLTKIERKEYLRMKFGIKGSMIRDADMATIGMVSSSGGESDSRHNFIERDF